MKLYEMSAIYHQLSEVEDVSTVKDTLDSLEDAIEVKAENIVKFLKSLEAENKAFKEEEDRLKKLRKSNEAKVEWLKTYLDDNLKLSGKNKLQAGIFKLSYRKTPPSVQIAEGAQVPEGFLVPQEPKIDKTNLKKWLQDGNEVEGISLEQREVLSIR